MLRVYVLIETQVGKTEEVVKALSKLEDVVSADAVTGPYDVIAVVECETIQKLGECITSKVQTIRGISRTVSCIAVPTSQSSQTHDALR
jgi:DNA-binding Lrp family transcriptional regulator